MTGTTFPAPLTPLVGIGWRHHHYAALLQKQPALGFIEVHSENFFAPGGAALAVLREGRELYPVSLHGVGLSLGSAAGIDPWHLERLAQLVQTIDPVRVSDHASFARGTSTHAADLLPTPLTRAALDVMCSNVNQVQERLGRPIAVENLSAYVQWAGAEMPEPEFLNELARRTGCGLLVDVNNIFVNALNAQLRGDSISKSFVSRREAADSATARQGDATTTRMIWKWNETQDPVGQCQSWLNAIEPAHVAEMHLAGHVHCGDIVIDDHGSRVVDAVWGLYQHAVQRFGAVPTLIEWDTDLPTLDVLLDEAARATTAAHAALATVECTA